MWKERRSLKANYRQLVSAFILSYIVLLIGSILVNNLRHFPIEMRVTKSHPGMNLHSHFRCHSSFVTKPIPSHFSQDVHRMSLLPLPSFIHLYYDDSCLDSEKLALSVWIISVTPAVDLLSWVATCFELSYDLNFLFMSMSCHWFERVRFGVVMCEKWYIFIT